MARIWPMFPWCLDIIKPQNYMLSAVLFRCNYTIDIGYSGIVVRAQKHSSSASFGPVTFCRVSLVAGWYYKHGSNPTACNNFCETNAWGLLVAPSGLVRWRAVEEPFPMFNLPPTWYLLMNCYLHCILFEIIACFSQFWNTVIDFDAPNGQHEHFTNGDTQATETHR